ncbi:MAG TPA: molybdopterin molybdotransferase MoeA [Nitrososphaeraceae archaeon]|nr:molybdopterin molybdotransferase MoeA [Nitrososphaeraceae archaeon]
MISRLTGYQYTSVGSAFEKIEQHIRLRPKPELVSTVAAYRRVLGENIISKSNIPAYDTSHMDGFAVKAKEISRASRTKPVFLKIIPRLVTNNSEKSDFHHRSHNASFLASWSYNVLRSGEAFEISTGGYLPKGADTIIPFEDATKIDNEIKVDSPFPKGAFVYPIGTDVKAKQPIFSKGQLLRAQDIGLLASLSIKKVVLYKKPTVGLIPTGSELSDELDHIAPGKKLNTNSLIIARLIQESGGLPIDFRITPDDMNAIRRKLYNALDTCDLILTTGGTSIGKHDLVQSAINSIGKPGMLTHGIKLDRGRVAGLALLNRKPIVCLPGPIQAALNVFIVFAYPMIRHLSGRLGKKPSSVFYATLTKGWEARKRFPDFLKVVYVKLSYYKNTFKADPLAGETESMSLLSKANGYILVPEKVRKMIAGQTVAVNLLRGFSDINGELI